MSDVLSNEQLDFLLKEINRMETQEKKEKSVKVYDFFVPNRFSKERIKVLVNVFENFSRAMSMYMSSACRVGCTVRVGSISEKKFGDFINSFDERDIMGVMEIQNDDTDYVNEKLLIRMPNKFCLFAYVKMLGDNGDRVYTEDSFVGRSDIECAVLSYFLSNIAPYMTSAWKNFYPAVCEFDSLDTHPRISQVMNKNDNVVDVQLEIMLSKMKQTLNICLPSDFLDEVYEYIDKNTRESGIISTENNEKQIMSSIEESKLLIRTVLDDIELTLGDVYNLQVDDILLLDKSKDEDVQMYIGDALWFTGALGTSGNNIAVRINDVVKRFND